MAETPTSPENGHDPPSSPTQEQLAASRERLASYHRLLEELPGIYERKFRERLQPTLERNRQLLEEGRRLRERIARALPAGPEEKAPAGITAGGRPALPPSSAPDPAPGRLPLLPLFVASTVPLLLVLLIASLWRTSGPAPRTSPPAAAERGPAPGELLVRTEGVSWLEVRDAQDKLIFSGLLEGKRLFPLVRGLRISAGRPDRVTVQTPGSSPRILGRIEQIDWQVFPPQPPAPAESPPPPADR